MFVRLSKNTKSNKRRAVNFTSLNSKLTRIFVHVSMLIIIWVSKLKQYLQMTGLVNGPEVEEKGRAGYPFLYDSSDLFYSRFFFTRIRDGWTNAISSVPGATIDVIDKRTDDYNLTFKFGNTTTKAINMGSYNYLGMAENKGPRCDAVCDTIKQYGCSPMSSRAEFGTTETLLELEQKVAKYFGVESSLVIGMGFATNSNNLPALIGGPGCLVLSDELNHASIIVGCKLSGATCRRFKHNDTVDLEKKLHRELSRGQPNSNGVYKPWRKAFIIVEGIFSMEGTIVNLPEVIRIKKKYKAYLYLDEAHSIGSLDKGVTFYYKCDPNDIDILMGTFTKSFGASGGYIAGKKSLIDYMRAKSHASCYAAAMAPPIARQIIGVIDSINGHEDPSMNEGYQRILTLKDNTKYFRTKLAERGFKVLGNEDSPVVPILVYSAGIVIEMLRDALKQNVALVGAGFPAVPLDQSRVRFCVSSAHTKEMLDEVVDVIDDLGDKYKVKFADH